MVSILPSDAKVSTLIDVDTRWWNLGLIHSIFNPSKAARICSLPLSPRGNPDQLIWRGTSNGIFSVRSAYHIKNEEAIRATSESSSASCTRAIREQLWTLRVPELSKIFYGESVTTFYLRS
ncbi:hypothetical protein SLA2020_268950 [Shorea laevis]